MIIYKFGTKFVNFHLYIWEFACEWTDYLNIDLDLSQFLILATFPLWIPFVYVYLVFLLVKALIAVIFRCVRAMIRALICEIIDFIRYSMNTD